MSPLAEALTRLEAIDREQEALARQRQALKREAWLTSGQTIGRARQLITNATLSLLSNGRAINAASLGSEIGRLAGNRDRFAEDLCDDWLNTTVEALESNGVATEESADAL
ncbi:MAG: hypothetical protein KJ944_11770 [Alphaproteobacteria bacterium]|nr:hypothetical protein [Alphaproteobacteria bacterium]MBU1560183.1 hypothetical protein [Alphaproteobacteria bacterium]MBU2303263.1 hypothetical protein [Alphaproteobacteria bacterium]MBU2370293.1 hypothetical protein [Alphaproteobacteria bacterium]